MSSQSGKPLLNLTLLYTVGNLATRLINFGLVFVTTFYLTKEEVGDYDLFVISLSLLTPIATLQLAESALRWLIEDSSPEKAKKVFSNILILLTLCLSVMGLVFAGLKYLDWLSNEFKLYALVFFQSYFIVFQQIVRGIGKNKLFVASSILYSFLYAILAVSSLYFTNTKIDGLIWANIIGSIFTCTYLFFAGGLSSYFSISTFSKHLSLSLLKYSIPLIPNTLSWWAIASANRFFILAYCGKAANGIFSISQKIPTILLIFTSIFYQAWQEKSISIATDKNSGKYHAEVFELYIRIMFTITIGIVTTSRILLKFLVSPQFFESWKYTSILLLGVIFNSLSSFLGTSYLNKKDTKGAMFSSISGGVITVFSSWILIPIYGLYGAGFGILFGYFIVFAIRNYDAYKLYGIKFPTGLFLTFLVLFLVSSSLNYLENLYVDIANIVFSTAMLLWLNKKVITGLLHKFLPGRLKTFNP